MLDGFERLFDEMVRYDDDIESVLIEELLDPSGIIDLDSLVEFAEGVGVDPYSFATCEELVDALEEEGYEIDRDALDLEEEILDPLEFEAMEYLA